MTDTIPTIQQPRRQRRWLFLVLLGLILIVGVASALLWRIGMVKDTIKQFVGVSAAPQAFVTIDSDDCSTLDRFDCAYALNCKPNVKQSPSCNGICPSEVGRKPSYMGCIALTDAELQQRSVDQADCEQIPGKSWHYGIGGHDNEDNISSRIELCSCEYLVDETLFSDGPMTRPYTLISLGTEIKKVHSDGCERAKSVCENAGGSLVGPILLSTRERPSLDAEDCQVNELWSDTDPTFLIWNSAAGVCEERTYKAVGGDLSFNCQTSPYETQSDFEVFNDIYFSSNYPTVIESK